MKSNIFVLFALLGASSCDVASRERPVEKDLNVAAPAAAEPVEAPKPAPLVEPRGPIDPKSVEAAGQVAQSYGALVEQGRWTEAAKLWGSDQAAVEFAAGLKPNRETHLEIGEPGRPEGAAGSVYVSMPVSFYGKRADGSAFRTPSTVILRRVNDVPGSSEEQRRWHIERIEPAVDATAR